MIERKKYSLHFLFLFHYQPNKHTSFLPLLAKQEGGIDMEENIYRKFWRYVIANF